MAKQPLKIHVLYESSDAGIPHGCGEIRLLRPLSHPELAKEITLTSGTELPEGGQDVVIIERFWDHSCSTGGLARVLQRLREKGTCVVVELDDDLLGYSGTLGKEHPQAGDRKIWLSYLLRQADGVIVSTEKLASRLSGLNRNIKIVPNMLDERLFAPSRVFQEPPVATPIRFGYMGTYTHLEDLFSIIAPLRRTLARYRSQVEMEIVGIGDHALLNAAFADFPVKCRFVSPEATTYAKFADWMQKHIRWDFGIAPLVDSQFSRSKSDIKYLDYAVQGIPGIFSAVQAYQRTIRPFENGLLAATPAEWSECLEKLVNDPELRLRLARNVHQDVWNSRMLAGSARRWLDAICWIRNSTKLAVPGSARH